MSLAIITLEIFKVTKIVNEVKNCKKFKKKLNFYENQRQYPTKENYRTFKKQRNIHLTIQLEIHTYNQTKIQKPTQLHNQPNS